MDLLINASLLHHQLQHEKIVLLDCSYYLNDLDRGRKEYYQRHIPGAHYLDTAHDLSGPVIPNVTGRHPLPDPMVFTYALRAGGLNDGDHVVAYDQLNGVYASRAWWLLSWLGHTNVSLLNGGLASWVKEGFETDNLIPPPAEGNFTPHQQSALEVPMEQLRTHKTIVDSREYRRYTGETEPIDPIAGHIPGAICIPYMDNVEENGIWKPKEWLAAKFGGLPVDTTPVFYCGSGVTACHNLFAFKLATGRDAALYGGSWSEWIHHQPIATGKLPG